MQVNYIIIHHTGVSRTKNPDQFEANNNYHKQKWNFKSSLGFYLGYHYEIAANGTIRQARAENEAGAHTVGHNYDSLALAIDGNFDIETPTPEEEKSLTNLLKDLKTRYPNAKITYHRQFANKTCPGKLIKDDWANNLTQKTMSNVKLVKITKKDGTSEMGYYLPATTPIALLDKAQNFGITVPILPDNSIDWIALEKIIQYRITE